MRSKTGPKRAWDVQASPDGKYVVQPSIPRCYVPRFQTDERRNGTVEASFRKRNRLGPFLRGLKAPNPLAALVRYTPITTSTDKIESTVGRHITDLNFIKHG